MGAAIGRLFNGTTVPLAGGALCCGLVSLGFVLLAEKGRLFRKHHAATAVGIADDAVAESFGH